MTRTQHVILEVTVPDNWQENQSLEFKYEGTKYEVNVPAGQRVGSKFNAQIEVITARGDSDDESPDGSDMSASSRLKRKLQTKVEIRKMMRLDGAMKGASARSVRHNKYIALLSHFVIKGSALDVLPEHTSLMHVQKELGRFTKLEAAIACAKAARDKHPAFRDWAPQYYGMERNPPFESTDKLAWSMSRGALPSAPAPLKEQHANPTAKPAAQTTTAGALAPHGANAPPAPSVKNETSATKSLVQSANTGVKQEPESQRAGEASAATTSTAAPNSRVGQLVGEYAARIWVVSPTQVKEDEDLLKKELTRGAKSKYVLPKYITDKTLNKGPMFRGAADVTPGDTPTEGTLQPPDTMIIPKGSLPLHGCVTGLVPQPQIDFFKWIRCPSNLPNAVSRPPSVYPGGTTQDSYLALISLESDECYKMIEYCRPTEARQRSARFVTHKVSKFVEKHHLQWLT